MVMVPPTRICRPATKFPTSERERTVMPQQGPSTLWMSLPGGGSKVVRMGIWWTGSVMGKSSTSRIRRR
jgi:hypothetical protein